MPGAGKQPPEVQEHIRELLEAGFDPTTIHRRLKVGRSSIYRMKRCLQQHGTAYMPVEMNKKNGRPKVLTAEQELEVRDWLANPQNRTRYLDDLVWLIHDRFNIVCSTTTMSKLKRKWLRVIECEETGQPIDEATRALLMETHPNLPILHQQPQQQQQTAPAAQMMAAQSMPPPPALADMDQQAQAQLALQQQQQMEPQIDARLQQDPSIDVRLQHHHPSPHMDARLQHQHHQQTTDPRLQQQSPQIDAQLQQQIQHEIAGSSAEPPRA